MMHRVQIVVLAIAVVLTGASCRRDNASAVPGPTDTPMAQAAEPTRSLVATATSVPMPTAVPVAYSGNFGVPAGNTFLVQTGVIDPERGLIYVLGQGGNANRAGGVLTVVGLREGQVRASVAIPITPDYSARAVLSGDGTRLYAIGESDGEEDLLIAIATGAGASPLGQSLATRPGVSAMAIDSAANRIYVLEEERIVCLDGQTLQTETPFRVGEVPSLSGKVLMALDSRAGRLYLSRRGGKTIAVYRADDGLARLEDIVLQYSVIALQADPSRPQTYALVEQSTQGGVVARVAVLREGGASAFWDSDPDYLIGGVVVDEVTGRVLLLADGRQGQTARSSRIRIVDGDTGEALQRLTMPYLNLAYARANLACADTLYRLAGTLVPVSLTTGRVGAPVHMDITLVSATLDEGEERLFVLDSAGTVRVLDPTSLLETAAWHGVLDPGYRAIMYAPLAFAGGRLYVSDIDGQVTRVLDPATGEEVATIEKPGQITADRSRDRLFLTNQGVYIVDPSSHQVTGSISETVRAQPMMVSPSAIRAQYDLASDLLFVTMSNNSAGSSNSSWLQIYDGETLARLDTPIDTDQQFVTGLAVNAEDGLVWVSGSFPDQTLTLFELQGPMVHRLHDLAGTLFLDQAAHRLYVATWGGLVTVDTDRRHVIRYRELEVAPSPVRFLAYAPRLGRLYVSASHGGELIALDPSTQPPPGGKPVEALPAELVQGLFVDAGGKVLAVVRLDEYGPSGLFADESEQVDGPEWVHLQRGLPPVSEPIIVAAPDTPNALFAHSSPEVYGYSWGVFRSIDGGHTWWSASRGLSSLDVRSLAVSPDFGEDGLALLVTGRSGLYRTRDGGKNWQHLADPLGGSLLAMARLSGGGGTFLVAGIDPQNQKEVNVYAGTADGTGVEWRSRLPTEGRNVYYLSGLSMSPGYAQDRIALIGAGDVGLFRSQDGAETWQAVGPSTTASSPRYTVLFSPDFSDDATVHLLVTQRYASAGDESGLFRSTDGGRNWQQATNADSRISALAMAPDGRLWAGDTGGRVYALEVDKLEWRAVSSARPIASPTPPPLLPTATPPPGPPSGSFQPEGAFAGLWLTDARVREELGWASEPRPHETSAALQPFQFGTMVWRSDTRQIYVLYGDGSCAIFDDTWTEGQPEWDASISAPEGLIQPKRGFGKVWREQEGVRDRLGWALVEEQGHTVIVQSFEHGTLVGMGEITFVIVDDGRRPPSWFSP